MELVKGLVLDGVGIGILPFRVATHGVVPGRLAQVSSVLPYFEDTVALVRRFDMHMTRSARLLLDALTEHCRQMPALPKIRNAGNDRSRDKSLRRRSRTRR
jgi:DNA-binding transcriptional LysR family regulator